MISERDLHDAIAECQDQKNPNANTCMKLASYYTILDHMNQYSYASEPTGQVRYDSGSEFSDAIRGKDVNIVLRVMDDLMDTVGVLSPKLYRVTMEKINNL